MTDFQPQNRIITVFGGSGFIGRHLIRALARDGWRIRVATRRPDLAFHLQPLGRVGQINAVQANIRYPDSLAAALREAEAAVNLVGILAPWGKQTFDSVQAEGAGAVAKAAADAGIANFVHVSAIGANADSKSAYARTKAAGEAAVLSALPSTKILRPSVVFGPEDQFFNRFATMARLMPALPLIGGGQTKLQPVYVGDLAEAGARLLRGEGQNGATYELGGPAVRTMKELLEFTLATIHRRRLLTPLPFAAAAALGSMMSIANKLLLGALPADFVFTADQVELLKHDNVVSQQAEAEGRTLAGLGITPESIEAVVPSYLYRFRKTGQYAGQRAV
ncbi:complex I NDUFA9 subunit family protein [Rhodoblastus acidophilus]|uniref:Complex I NDUFA9 subunit family protein n=1 Tax=Candidatus Rhodoblastus alkanivorans TaxID=2954117 RepID=A0ABS9Z2Y1_9HYPH|nr:complex I NDUFA9 subunit family protein [Candidatus Rhodoblastus alkanivorans]MCI4679734.1 complex I NDUFA9 subunit family protein [Candidatus Rhodoblastus alkanivorans]MCI4681972.1 complex I NDUFA9 subunit family protein [Candidatus Rhodoblastus alkanivorans]MDI4643023.1 complex I NDUFA9 subunit family protein [Rhodoblastus acidophilus]